MAPSPSRMVPCYILFWPHAPLHPFQYHHTRALRVQPKQGQQNSKLQSRVSTPSAQPSRRLSALAHSCLTSPHRPSRYARCLLCRVPHASIILSLILATPQLILPQHLVLHSLVHLPSLSLIARHLLVHFLFCFRLAPFKTFILPQIFWKKFVPLLYPFLRHSLRFVASPSTYILIQNTHKPSARNQRVLRLSHLLWKITKTFYRRMVAPPRTRKIIQNI